MPYNDLGEFLQALENSGNLKRIPVEVDKDWEVSAVSRRVFQRVPSERRPALLFEKIRGYDIPIAVGVLGGSPEIYAKALDTTVDDVYRKWNEGTANPIEPVIVTGGPCKEIIKTGPEVDLYELPHPVWTVDYDPGPYVTSPFMCTKDPAGRRNLGTYRLQVKDRNHLGVMITRSQNMELHIQEWEAIGKPTPVAIIIGAEPSIGLTSVAKFPHGVDEYAMSGGLRGLPVELVRCETVDVEVPAGCEIVIEGEIPPGYREWEGPFGEYTGYMGPAGESWVIEVKAVTRRRKPIYQAFLSQMPPSESSMIKSLGRELPLLRHLRQTLGFTVRDVVFTEHAGAGPIILISMKKQYEGQVLEVIWATWSFSREWGKFTIVVDDDIDVRDFSQVLWALAFRSLPAKDAIVADNCLAVALDPSTASREVPQYHPSRVTGSKVAIDATRKHAYPPVALPPREHLALVDQNWRKYGFED